MNETIQIDMAWLPLLIGQTYNVINLNNSNEIIVSNVIIQGYEDGFLKFLINGVNKKVMKNAVIGYKYVENYTIIPVKLEFGGKKRKYEKHSKRQYKNKSRRSKRRRHKSRSRK